MIISTANCERAGEPFDFPWKTPMDSLTRYWCRRCDGPGARNFAKRVPRFFVFDETVGKKEQRSRTILGRSSGWYFLRTISYLLVTLRVNTLWDVDFGFWRVEVCTCWCVYEMIIYVLMFLLGDGSTRWYFCELILVGFDISTRWYYYVLMFLRVDNSTCWYY